MDSQLEPYEIFNKSGSVINISGEELKFDVPRGQLILLSCLYGGISLVAVIGNTLVIWIVLTTRQMHTVTNFYIGNLALADVIIGLFAIPFQFQAAVKQRWDLPRFMCPFCPFVQALSVNVSIFTLTAIAIDRHKAILNPLRARSSKHLSKIIIGIIWLLALALAVPMAIAMRVDDIEILFDVLNENGTTTVTQFPNITKPFCRNLNLSDTSLLIYRFTLVFVQYIIPVCVISFVYIQMAVKLWGSKTPGNAQDLRDITLLKNKKKVIKMLVIVVVLFSVAWFPFQMYFIVDVTWPEINFYQHINIIYFGCDWLAMSNSCYNPFIYGIYNEKFKREFYKRFTFFYKLGFGKRFQSQAGMATGATSLTDCHDKTISMYNTRASISHNSSHFKKKSCCVRNENMFQTNNGVVFKNSYVTEDDDDNYTITSTPFIENNRCYNPEAEDFELTKII